MALALAKAHVEVEPSIRCVYRILSEREEDAQEPIKLLEVNPETPPSGIVPVAFGQARDIPYASIVVEVTPEEFERILSGHLNLPEGWRLGEEHYGALEGVAGVL